MCPRSKVHFTTVNTIALSTLILFLRHVNEFFRTYSTVNKTHYALLYCFIEFEPHQNLMKNYRKATLPLINTRFLIYLLFIEPVLWGKATTGYLRVRSVTSFFFFFFLLVVWYPKNWPSTLKACHPEKSTLVLVVRIINSFFRYWLTGRFSNIS
jgi:hypothetical protein